MGGRRPWKDSIKKVGPHYGLHPCLNLAGANAKHFSLIPIILLLDLRHTIPSPTIWKGFSSITTLNSSLCCIVSLTLCCQTEKLPSWGNPISYLTLPYQNVERRTQTKMHFKIRWNLTARTFCTEEPGSDTLCSLRFKLK